MGRKQQGKGGLPAGGDTLIDHRFAKAGQAGVSVWVPE
jgi:hypothetical protein